MEKAMENTAATKKSLKVMMIGNSFSICVGKNFPAIVRDIEGLDLVLGSAYIGGCSLETHWRNLDAILQNPDAPEKEAYLLNVWNSENPENNWECRGTVKQLLEAEDWDIISIQQASHCSSFSETYQPWADQLLDYLHRTAPRAKVVIQQTWAYRSDDGRITDLGEPQWGFHQNGMYERLTASYRKLAEHAGCFVIPTGLAVQLTRQHDSLKFKETPAEQKALLAWPDLPAQAGDPVGRSFWWKNEEGELHLSADTIHLNVRGEYLQACVWFRSLFGLSAEKYITYESNVVSRNDCIFLRKMADLAVDNFEQYVPLFD